MCSVEFFYQPQVKYKDLIYDSSRCLLLVETLSKSHLCALR